MKGFNLVLPDAIAADLWGEVGEPAIFLMWVGQPDRYNCCFFLPWYPHHQVASCVARLPIVADAGGGGSWDGYGGGGSGVGTTGCIPLCVPLVHMILP